MFPYTVEEIAAKVARASAFYWKTRRGQARKQKMSGMQDAGTRGQVTGGKQLDGFAKLIQEIGIKAGCCEEDVYFNTSIPLPGYYRPQKNWDIIFLHDGKLLAAIELKSLCALLRSTFVTSQIRNVSVQMRGGSIRYQAQNLRNVHIPAWSSLSVSEVDKLVSAYEANDIEELDVIVDAVVRDSSSRQPVQHFQADLF